MKTTLKTAALIATGAAVLIGGTAAAHYLSPREAADAVRPSVATLAPTPVRTSAEPDTRGVHPGGELAPSRMTASAAGKLTLGTKLRDAWLSPADFHPVGDPRECALTRHAPDHYLGNKFAFRSVGPCQKYLARVPLPEGAYIESLTAYGLDNDPVAQMAVGLEHPMVTKTGSIMQYTELGSSSSSNSTYSMNPDTFGLRPKELVDFQHLYLPYNTGLVRTYPMVVLLIPASEKLSILYVELTWRPTYGTQYATASFSDVPLAHAYSNEVESLAKAGISNGCGGGKFCVDAPVTRGQMAVFLSRALGLYDETANDPPAQ